MSDQRTSTNRFPWIRWMLFLIATLLLMWLLTTIWLNYGWHRTGNAEQDNIEMSVDSGSFRLIRTPHRHLKPDTGDLAMTITFMKRPLVDEDDPGFLWQWNPIPNNGPYLPGVAGSLTTIPLWPYVFLLFALSLWWAAVGTIRTKAGRCKACGYDASGLGVCPECGADLAGDAASPEPPPADPGP